MVMTTTSYASDPGSSPGDSPFCTCPTQHADLAYFWGKYPKIPLKSKVLPTCKRPRRTLFTPEGPRSRPSCPKRTVPDSTQLRQKVQTKTALLTFTPPLRRHKARPYDSSSLKTKESSSPHLGSRLKTKRAPRGLEPSQQATELTKAKCI